MSAAGASSTAQGPHVLQPPPAPALAEPGVPARRSLTVAAAVVVALAVVPLVAPADVASLLTRVLAVALLAASLDVLVGLGGMPSLGHAAPFGVGAYAAALTAKELTPWAPAQLLMGVLGGLLLSVLVGWLVVRARGTFFLMLSLAVAELVHTSADRFAGLTGGSNGLVGVPALTFLPGGGPVLLTGLVYWWGLLVAVTGFAVLVVVSRSAFGRTLRGLRDNEERMASLGYSTTLVKYKAFCLCGAVAGAAGAVYAAQSRFVSPADLGFQVSVVALLAVVIGGRGSLWGPLLGAALVVLVRDEIGPRLDGRGPLLLGLVFIAAVYLLPRGIAGARLPRRRAAR